jgi:hypothetical protein
LNVGARPLRFDFLAWKGQQRTSIGPVIASHGHAVLGVPDDGVRQRTMAAQDQELKLPRKFLWLALAQADVPRAAQRRHVPGGAAPEVVP